MGSIGGDTRERRVFFRVVKMKPWLILLVWPTILIVTVGAQSHRFAQPFRRRRIEGIEATNVEGKKNHDRNNENNKLEVKRLMELMKGIEGRDEPGTDIASKTDKQNSKTQNTLGSGRIVVNQSQ